MTQLKKFLESGKLGPIVLGVTPNEVMGWLGDAELTSRKSNPLQLKYGSLQLVFWRPRKRTPHQLHEIIISFQPNFEPLPPSLKLDDFLHANGRTEHAFRQYIHSINLPPSSMEDGASGRQLLFLSGVTVLFTRGLLHLSLIHI